MAPERRSHQPSPRRAAIDDHARCRGLECSAGIDHQTAGSATVSPLEFTMQPKPCNQERQASPRHGRGLIIYDFDGVIADSEVIANAVLAEMVTELGRPTTLADCYRLYMGKRFVDVVAAIEASLGSSLPEGFAASYQARTLVHLQRDLRTVAGARQH